MTSPTCEKKKEMADRVISVIVPLNGHWSNDYDHDETVNSFRFTNTKTGFFRSSEKLHTGSGNCSA